MWLELWPSFPDLLKIPCEFTNLACVGMLSFIRVSCVFQRYIPSKTLRGCLIFWSFTSWLFKAELLHFPMFGVRYLKPDAHKKSKHKTAVIKKTLNPEFNEVGVCVCVCVWSRPGVTHQLCLNVNKYDLKLFHRVTAWKAPPTSHREPVVPSLKVFVSVECLGMVLWHLYPPPHTSPAFFCLFVCSPGVFLWNHLLRASQKDAGGDGVGLRPGQVQWLHRWVGAPEGWGSPRCSLLWALTEPLRGMWRALSRNQLQLDFLRTTGVIMLFHSACYAGIF